MSTNENIDFVDAVIKLHKEKKWKEIINNYYDEKERSKLLWVFPSEKNLTFITENLKMNKLNRVISVGCGSGLFEWILQESSGITLTCIEIDDAWWKCKYAPPTFCELHYAQYSLDNDSSTINILNDKNAAIMFCYFNNRPAFLDYLKYYTGNILIIIGPGEGKQTHTDPTPFEPNIDKTWHLFSSQEVRESKDFIAIYHKKRS